MSPVAGPALHLDWEEGVFLGLRRLWRSLSGGPSQGEADAIGRAAHLDPLARRLSVLASLVADAPLRVLPARDQGGLRGDDLLVPARLDLAPDPQANAGLYILRVVLGATLHRLGPDATVDGAVEVLRAELPAFGPAWDEALALQQRAGRVVLWGPRLSIEGGVGAGEADEQSRPPGQGTEAEALPVEEIKVHDLKEEEAIALPVHAFEKVELAEAFNGTMRQLDGEDDLADQLEALEEVKLGDLLRGGPEAHSLLRADISLDADIPDVGSVGADEPHVLYDEWDGRKGRYQPGWCRVYPTAMPRGDEGWARGVLHRHTRTVERLHAELARHRDRLRARPRELDGEDVDVEALTDAWATVRAGHTPSPRLYIRQSRQQRELATLVLLDVSLSTDAWVDDRRVLDVARESVLVLGEVADRLGDRLAIQAFASHTRHRVRVWTVRDWHEAWTVGRGRLGRLQPQGYTRIGPALRHATATLSGVQARRRQLLLVSDGKPTDYDRYEGRHGMADVRQALREAGQRGIHVHALAIDEVARDWLPAMMGPGAWTVLRKPEELPAALTRVWGRGAT